MGALRGGVSKDAAAGSSSGRPRRGSMGTPNIGAGSFSASCNRCSSAPLLSIRSSLIDSCGGGESTRISAPNPERVADERLFSTFGLRLSFSLSLSHSFTCSASLFLSFSLSRSKSNSSFAFRPKPNDRPSPNSPLLLGVDGVPAPELGVPGPGVAGSDVEQLAS